MTRALHLKSFIAALWTLRDGLVAAARLEALRELGLGQLDAKRGSAERCVTLIEAADAVEDFTLAHYGGRAPAIEWPSELRPDDAGFISDGAVALDMLEVALVRRLRRCRATFDDLLKAAEINPLLSSVTALRAQLIACLPDADGAAPLDPIERAPSSQKGRQAVRGPARLAVDASFAPTYSLLQRPVSAFGESLRENIPYFWSLALRESLAADLCALSIVEYDAMPMQFYCDMAKQCWDEMRHSTYFLDLAKRLMPEFERNGGDDPLSRDIARYLETGRGLPIPRERNLYEAILNASLAERLILLHRDTETPGITRIKEKIASPFCRSHPEIAEALEIIMRDEVTHSRFGAAWLEHLLPDKAERDAAIELTELLRGVLLLSSFAHHGERSLGELIAENSADAAAPTAFANMD